ncbi:hypothetical protein BH23ACT9_BH23ACT9_27060 [soil metagenome]
MGLPRDIVSEIRRLNESQLRQVLILARGLLLDSEVPVVEITDIPGMPALRYRQRTVACGKATCGRCPHGPYWYAHWTEEGRKRSQYIGAELPAEVARKLEAMDARRHDTADPGGVEQEAAQIAASAGGGHDRHAPRRLRLVRD